MSIIREQHRITTEQERERAQYERERNPAAPPGMLYVEPTDLASIGWIVITNIGQENIYFDLADGTRCFSGVEGFTAEGMRELRGLGYWRA